MLFLSPLCANAIFHYLQSGSLLEIEMRAGLPFPQLVRHFLTFTQQESPWEPWEVFPSRFLHHEVWSTQPSQEVASFQVIHFHCPHSLLRVLWVAVVVFPTQSNQRQLKKKCQGKQNESLGDPVMSTEHRVW